MGKALLALQLSEVGLMEIEEDIVTLPGEFFRELCRGNEILKNISLSGVSFEDPRLRYLEVQIDRKDWEECQQFVKTGNQSTVDQGEVESAGVGIVGETTT